MAKYPHAFGHKEILIMCFPEYDTCFDCGVVIKRSECANGTRCDRCWFTYHSESYSKPDEARRSTRYVMGMKLKHSRWMHSQLNRMTCRECGSKLRAVANHLKDDVRLMVVWCRNHRTHQWLALVDHKGNVRDVYDVFTWWAAGRVEYVPTDDELMEKD